MKSILIQPSDGPQVLKPAEFRSSGRARKLSAFLLLAALATGIAQGKDTPPAAPVVHLANGALRGTLQSDTAVFKAIPFAAPPVGDLRWRPPQPAANWKGVRDATQSAPYSMQNPTALDPFIQPLAADYGVDFPSQTVPTSEDCLYLNVYAPQWPVKSPLPVMVWIHGGSNRVGSGSQPIYDGTSLAAHGVLVVTVNYRLGIFGFFSHPALTAESPHRSSGNYGLLDQLAALQWVQQNIAQFGGDPRNVTVFGESAGSIDIGMLLVSPLSTNLFRRAILESGPPFGLGSIHNLHEAEATGAALAQAAPGNPATPLENLRKLSAPDLLKFASDRTNGAYDASSVVDGWVLTQSPARAFSTGALQPADLIIGFNGRELSAFRVAAAARAKAAPTPAPPVSVTAMVGKLADTARPLYGNFTYLAIAKYVLQSFSHKDQAIDQLSNDMLIACPIGAMAVLHNATGQKTFIYRFDRSIPGKGEADLGAFHSIELAYVFNTFQNRSWRWLPFTSADLALSTTVEDYWTNFAKSGDPNARGLPAWPTWQDGSEPYLQFTPSAVPAAQQDLSPSFCSLSADRLRKSLAESK
jgi:para-nitrobenzyl esterase